MSVNHFYLRFDKHPALVKDYVSCLDITFRHSCSILALLLIDAHNAAELVAQNMRYGVAIHRFMIEAAKRKAFATARRPWLISVSLGFERKANLS